MTFKEFQLLVNGIDFWQVYLLDSDIYIAGALITENRYLEMTVVEAKVEVDDLDVYCTVTLKE